MVSKAALIVMLPIDDLQKERDDKVKEFDQIKPFEKALEDAKKALDDALVAAVIPNVTDVSTNAAVIQAQLNVQKAQKELDLKLNEERKALIHPNGVLYSVLIDRLHKKINKFADSVVFDAARWNSGFDVYATSNFNAKNSNLRRSKTGKPGSVKREIQMAQHCAMRAKTAMMMFKKSQNQGAWKGYGNYKEKGMSPENIFASRVGKIKSMVLLTEAGSTILCFCGRISRIGASKTFKCSNSRCGGRIVYDDATRAFRMERDPKSAVFIENTLWAIALEHAEFEVDELRRRRRPVPDGGNGAGGGAGGGGGGPGAGGGGSSGEGGSGSGDGGGPKTPDPGGAGGGDEGSGPGAPGRRGGKRAAGDSVGGRKRKQKDVGSAVSAPSEAGNLLLRVTPQEMFPSQLSQDSITPPEERSTHGSAVYL
ncbi:hypothetical protein HDU98_008289 [Podochytrium sp. JEL0797]|nr:hypothetical protein HDU98_008289 [Podochytrium sp. JEL0797]